MPGILRFILSMATPDLLRPVLRTTSASETLPSSSSSSCCQGRRSHWCWQGCHAHTVLSRRWTHQRHAASRSVNLAWCQAPRGDRRTTWACWPAGSPGVSSPLPPERRKFQRLERPACRVQPPAVEAWPLSSELAETWEYFSACGHGELGNPHTDKAYQDEQTQRRIWTLALRAAGVRYRPPKECRDTSVTMALMASANPMWLAMQHGHMSASDDAGLCEVDSIGRSWPESGGRERSDRGYIRGQEERDLGMV